jgi:hypothetical protein
MDNLCEQMFHKLYIPHPALKEFINCIGVMHFEIKPGQEPCLCPFPPTPQHCMIFYVGDRVLTQKEGEDEFRIYSRSLIVGPQVTRVNIKVRKSHKAVLVGFQPGGLYRLLGIPMKELFDEGFDAREVLGKEMDEVVDQLRNANLMKN